MMFMLLFYGDDKKIAGMLESDPTELMTRHVKFNAGIVQKRSKLIAAHALQPAKATMTVRPDGGTRRVFPGPATDTTFVLNGFYLINCKNMDEALDIARSYEMPEDLGYVEVRPAVQEWKTAPVVDSPAAADTLWALYRDVASWPAWLDGVSEAELDGPFAAGTGGTLRLADGETRTLRLATVTEPESFTMEVRLADGIWLWVGHYLTPLPTGGTRITHEPVVPHAALDVFGIHFTQGVNAQAQASVERLAERALAVERSHT
jgi:hypothetical protein